MEKSIIIIALSYQKFYNELFSVILLESYLIEKVFLFTKNANYKEFIITIVLQVKDEDGFTFQLNEILSPYNCAEQIYNNINLILGANEIKHEDVIFLYIKVKKA